MLGATVRVGVGLRLWLALLIGLSELVSRLILVGSSLRGLEWRTLLGDELSLILLTRRGGPDILVVESALVVVGTVPVLLGAVLETPVVEGRLA